MLLNAREGKNLDSEVHTVILTKKIYCRSLGLILGFLLVSFGSLPVQSEVRNPEDFFFHQHFGEMQDESAAAKSDGLEYIMVMFELSDCPWCERMKTSILNQSEIQDYYRANFRPLMMNVESENPVTNWDGTDYTESDFATEVVRVRASPEFVFFDLNGNVIVRFTGVTKNKEEFMLLGRYVAEGYYRSVDFGSFRDSQ